MAKTKKKVKKEEVKPEVDGKEAFVELMEQLDKAYYAAKDDIEKITKGVAKAGRRFRGNIMEIRNLTKELRKVSISLTRKSKEE